MADSPVIVLRCFSRETFFIFAIRSSVVRSLSKLSRVFRFLPMIVGCLILCGCPKPAAEHQTTPPREQPDSTIAATDNKEMEAPEAEAAKEKSPAENNLSEESGELPRDLGPPLVDHPENLKKLHPIYPVWIDTDNKQVVIVGEICQTNVPLEMFACPRGTKEHESIVSVPTEAFIVHSALLAIGAKSGKPVQFTPKYSPATGSEIDIIVRWKNEKGDVQSARAQDWIREMKTGKALEQPWVFGGSGFWKDESTGKEYYQAEGGDLICVANFPSAMLDLPIESSDMNADLLFQAFTERIPPRGTPVTLILILKTEHHDSEP